MNLLYSAFILEDSEVKGFLKKVISQCNVFKKEFENIYLYISRKDEAVLYKVEKDSVQEIETFKYNKLSIYKKKSKIRKIRGFLRYNSFLNHLNKIIYTYKIDVLYLRILPPSKKLIGIMNNKWLIKLVEFPTYPYEEEYKKTKSKIEQIIFLESRTQKS